MPTGMQDFINTFFQAEQLKNQRRQMEVLEQNSQAQRAQTFTTLMRLTSDPEMRNVYADLMPELSRLVGPELAPTAEAILSERMMQGLEGLDPETDRQAAEATALRETTGMGRSGLASEEFLAGLTEGITQGLTGDELGNLRRERRSQLAAGAPAGDVALSSTLADLSPEDQEVRAKIVSGLKLDAQGEAQVENWLRNLGLGWAQLADTSARGTVQLMLQWQDAQNRHELAKQQGMEELFPPPGTVLTTMSGALEGIKGAETDAEKVMQIQMFNNAADVLGRMNLWTSAARLPNDPNNLNVGIIETLSDAIHQISKGRFGSEASPLDMVEQAGQGEQISVQQLLQSLVGMTEAERQEFFDSLMRGGDGGN